VSVSILRNVIYYNSFTIKMPYVLIVKLLTMFRNMVSKHILKTKPKIEDLK